MNLRRQLLLVSLLTLVLPWAGCEFIRETEKALRENQQQMLAGTARAFSESLAGYPEEFPPLPGPDHLFSDQFYAHFLDPAPVIDGYFDDWPLTRDSLVEMRGADGPVRFALGLHGARAYLYAEVVDRNVVYATPSNVALDDGPRYADRLLLVSSSPPMSAESIVFAAEAPGAIVSYLLTNFGFAPEPTVEARWQDVPGGYQVEARIPVNLLGTHLGLEVINTSAADRPGVRSRSFESATPGPVATISPYLTDVVTSLLQPGMRMIVADHAGWRVVVAGEPESRSGSPASPVSSWMRIAYNALLEPGTEPALAEPDPEGRERQPYVLAALDGRRQATWFRSVDGERAIVAVAEPIVHREQAIGAIILQQGTDAILSLRNEGLARLMNVTLIATFFVAAALLGYATWLSRRIRRLSVAAESALLDDALRNELPSSNSGDEVGDLSRSFSHVLRQLADYNEYLRSLASKLSHELRTPLAIVTSSLENLEHEQLDEASAGYTARAREGADRLRRILSAMSEASRVEELMEHVEPESFDLRQVLDATISAYRDAYPERRFEFDCELGSAIMSGSPELLIQLLDKLVDNAADFSNEGDVITVSLEQGATALLLGVQNPGPPLPEHMRSQLFDSMVSVRNGAGDRHLGLGLYIAKLIAEGHGGHVTADNASDGVRFTVSLPVAPTEQA